MQMSADKRTTSHHIDRRDFLVGAGAATIGLGIGAPTQAAEAPDYALRIAPIRLEIAPGKVIETFAYNGIALAQAIPTRAKKTRRSSCRSAVSFSR